ncbi:major facilitator superfamily domain-containing protein [Fusarium tricinctum]|uniref:Major facilitator superfamily domain-containing protein n=1 Tax=Fusarium tricinctum TaxID=61284 RepID=A0A8K0S0Y2_9HYPO|nr:major facilitator superfamily domain-containing protein [Fusarium tricinctum]
MTPQHGFSVPSRAKRRFATPVPSRDAFVEEQELLLQPQDQCVEEQNEVVANEPSPLRQHFTLLALGYISFIFLKLSPGMFNTILSQILEGILCRQYHDTTDPTSDPRCKDESVQGELSILLSMKATFELLPTVIFSIPYGLAADVYGRKPVLIIATMGCVIYGLVNLVICTGPATYYLMPIGEWHAISIALGFQVLGLVTTFFIPETLVVKNEESDADSSRDRHSITANIRSRSQELLTKSFQSLRDIFWSDTTITLFVLSLLFIDVGEDIGSIITKQYAAKRFHLSWPEAGFITSMKSFAQLGLCLGALPYAQRVMRQSNVSAIKQDVWIARTCLIILVIAYCMAGFADNLVMFASAIIMSAVNFCLNPALRSLLLAMAHGAGAGAVLSAVEVLNAISAVVAGPVMAEGFRLGMGWGGMWLGLHWFIAMFILLPGAVIIICMRFDAFERRRDS